MISKSIDSQLSCKSRIVDVLVIAIMPSLYGAATRLPFIYFVIHLENHFHLDWLTIGLFVACYQGSRVVTSALAIPFPKLSQFLGTAVGFAGYLIVYMISADKDSMVPFVAGTAIVGFSETMSSMQKYAKVMYKDNPKQMLRYQYAFVMFGVMCAFLIGGFVYQSYKIAGVALTGVMIQGVALIAFFTYLALSREEDFEETQHSSSQSNELNNKPSTTTANKADKEHQEEVEEIPAAVLKKSCTTTTSGIEDVVEAGMQDVSSDAVAARGADDSAARNEYGEDNTKDVEITILDENVQTQGEDTKNTMKMQEVDEDENFTGATMIIGEKKSRRPSVTRSTSGSLNSEQSTSTPDHSIIMCLSDVLMRKNSLKGSYYVNDNVPASWINWLLCTSFGIEALTIGYNLSIGPIFLLSEFNKDTGIIGLLFAVGAASGAIVAISATCTSLGMKIMNMIATSPFDLCFAMGGIAVGVFVAAIPNFVGHVIGLVLLMCFNDLGAMVMTELQASITTVSNYSVVGPFGQVIRRSLNVVTALTGPLLFGVFPRLPYLVAGGITMSWTVLLYVAFRYRIDTSTKIIGDRTGQPGEVVTNKRFSFIELETIRGLSKHDVDALKDSNATLSSNQS